ncbi:MAG: GntR family transcriptional regulator [Bacteroidota bacterium]
MEFNNTGRAIYLQIADYLCEKILLKEWQPEDKIPSVRELAVQLEVNPNTAMRAYELLKTNQVIYDKRGIGYFVTPGAVGNASNFRKQDFMEKEMPSTFRIMYMLGLEPADLELPYAKFKGSYKPA